MVVHGLVYYSIKALIVVPSGWPFARTMYDKQKRSLSMINHVVLLQFKPETTPEQISDALEHVQALQTAIPGILSISTGENKHLTNHQGYRHGFIIQFDTAEHLRDYAPHPAHQPVSAELRRLCQSLLNFDL